MTATTPQQDRLDRFWRLWPALNLLDYWECRDLAPEEIAAHKARERHKFNADKDAARHCYDRDSIWTLDRLTWIRCPLCADDYVWADIDRPEPLMVIDHIVPIGRGGHHHRDNIWLLCVSCNARKSDFTMWELCGAEWLTPVSHFRYVCDELGIEQGRKPARDTKAGGYDLKRVHRFWDDEMLPPSKHAEAHAAKWQGSIASQYLVPHAERLVLP